MEAGRYIERNPVNAEMVPHPSDYPWSSYRFYAEEVANTLITPDPGFMSLGVTNAEQRHRYEEYITAVRPYEMPNPDRLYPIFQGW